jgi:hypothetical protein
MIQRASFKEILKAASRRWVSNVLGSSARRGFVFVGLLLFAANASAQEWQSYQLTDFPPNGSVRQCGTVADSLGNLHHYFIAGLGNGIDPWYVPELYLRTDFYGHVLTDTVRVNGFNGDNCWPSYTSVVGDGANSWCLFSDQLSPENDTRGLYLTGRNIQGQEILPATLLGVPSGGGGPPSWDLAAVLRTSDSTLHVVGNGISYHYYRFTTSGQVLVWNQRIDGLVVGVDPQVHLGPDGAVWAAMRDGYSDAHTDILLVRFGEDTSQTVYRPFVGTPQMAHWYMWDYGIDAGYNFHFLLCSDTVGMAYFRLDSSLTLRESHVLGAQNYGFAKMRVDSAGNCVLVWDNAPGLKWAYRRADGTWIHSPTIIDANMEAASFSIVVMDSERFAFTAEAGPHGSLEQLYLYTYNFPPYNAVPQPRHSNPIVAISAYPNPFTSSLTLNLPQAAAKEVTLYDILGRIVFSQPVPTGARTLNLTPSALGSLPSGTYFLALRGNSATVPLQITHFK